MGKITEFTDKISRPTRLIILTIFIAFVLILTDARFFQPIDDAFSKNIVNNQMPIPENYKKSISIAPFIEFIIEGNVNPEKIAFNITLLKTFPIPFGTMELNATNVPISIKLLKIITDLTINSEQQRGIFGIIFYTAIVLIEAKIIVLAPIFIYQLSKTKSTSASS